MQRLHLGAEGEDLLILRARLAVEPLAQNAGGGIDAAGVKNDEITKKREK